MDTATGSSFTDTGLPVRLASKRQGKTLGPDVDAHGPTPTGSPMTDHSSLL